MLAKYYKAVVAFLGVVAAGLTALSGSTDFTSVLPNGVSGWLLTAGAAVVGVLTFVVRNQKTIDAVDTALSAGDFSLKDLELLIAKYKK